MLRSDQTAKFFYACSKSRGHRPKGDVLCLYTLREEGGREYLLAGLDRRNRFGCFGCTPIKLGVEGVIVTRVQMLLHHAQRIAEALEVYDFAFPQEFQRVAHIGVINQTKQIVIGCACLLFCCKRARAAY